MGAAFGGAPIPVFAGAVAVAGLAAGFAFAGVVAGFGVGEGGRAFAGRVVSRRSTSASITRVDAGTAGTPTRDPRRSAAMNSACFLALAASGSVVRVSFRVVGPRMAPPLSRWDGAAFAI
jgi:hypothetical protein